MRSKNWGWLALLVSLAIGGASCSQPSARYRWLEDGTKRTWQPSFVVLFGRDPVAPERAPKSCFAIAGIDFVGQGEKAYHFASLRRAAQDVGGNGVTQIRLVSRRGQRFLYTAIIVDCSEHLFTTANPRRK